MQSLHPDLQAHRSLHRLPQLQDPLRLPQLPALPLPGPLLLPLLWQSPDGAVGVADPVPLAVALDPLNRLVPFRRLGGIARALAKLRDNVAGWTDTGGGQCQSLPLGDQVFDSTKLGAGLDPLSPALLAEALAQGSFCSSPFTASVWAAVWEPSRSAASARWASA